MPSTYSPNLRLELIANGEQAGSWGTTTNTNLGTLLDSAIAGASTVSVTTANQALTASNGAADQARNATLTLTTTTTAAFAVYAPPVSKQYTIYNSAAYDATIYNSTVLGNTTAAGTGVVIPAGKKLTVWTNGTNFSIQINHLPALSLTTDLAVADGGTGASDAATARTNLGLGTIATQPASSVTITGGSITGITDLAVADGGTGASDAATARTNLGLGTMATQASSAVSISGGTITGITDLAVADGGTGASDAATARTNLGLGTMATQASSAVSITGGTIAGATITGGSVSGITALAAADGGTGLSSTGSAGNILVSTGSGWTSQAISASAPINTYFRNLYITVPGTSSFFNVTADELSVSNSTFGFVALRNVAFAIDASSSGANGLDTGTLATSTWYSVWAIYNGTLVRGLLSASGTAPTLPSGYTYKTRIGWIRTDSTANKYPLSMVQYGSSAQYKISAGGNLTAYPVMASGSTASVTTAVSVANAVPSSTATRIALSFGTTSGSASTFVTVGPNSQAAAASGAQPFAFMTSTTTQTQNVTMSLESTSIYWCGNNSLQYIACTGWVDNF